MSFVCVLSCVISGGGPDIVLTTHSGRLALVYLSSVLVHVCCSPNRHLTHGHLGCKSRGGVSPTLGKGNNSERKKERKKRKINSQYYIGLNSIIQMANVYDLFLFIYCKIQFHKMLTKHQKAFYMLQISKWESVITVQRAFWNNYFNSD